MGKLNEQELDRLMKAVSEMEVAIPRDLHSKTLKAVEQDVVGTTFMLPYLVATVIFINMLTAIVFGGTLYLIETLPLWVWLIIGSVYASINGLFYGLTYVYRERISNMMNSIGGLRDE